MGVRMGVRVGGGRGGVNQGCTLAGLNRLKMKTSKRTAAGSSSAATLAEANEAGRVYASAYRASVVPAFVLNYRLSPGRRGAERPVNSR